MTVSYSGQKKEGKRNVKFRRSGTLKSKSILKKRIRIPLFKTQKPDTSVTH